MALYRCITCGNTVDTTEPGPPRCDEHEPGRWMRRVYRSKCPGSGAPSFGGTICHSCGTEPAVDERGRFEHHTWITARP